MSSDADRLKKVVSTLRGGNNKAYAMYGNGLATVAYNHNDNLWDNLDEVNKALIDGSTRLLFKLYWIERVVLTIPYENSLFTVDIDIDKFESFTHEELHKLRDNRVEDFVDKYVYDKDKRNEFINRFVRNDEIRFV